MSSRGVCYYTPNQLYLLYFIVVDNIILVATEAAGPHKESVCVCVCVCVCW